MSGADHPRFRMGERVAEDRKTLAVDDGLENLSCPCGKTFSLATTRRGERAIVHVEPACRDFLKRDPVDFMRWVRVMTALGLKPN